MNRCVQYTLIGLAFSFSSAAHAEECTDDSATKAEQMVAQGWVYENCDPAPSGETYDIANMDGTRLKAYICGKETNLNRFPVTVRFLNGGKSVYSINEMGGDISVEVSDPVSLSIDCTVGDFQIVYRLE